MRDLISSWNQKKITHNSIVSYSNLQAGTALADDCLIIGSQDRLTRNGVSYNQIWIKTDKNAIGTGI